MYLLRLAIRSQFRVSVRVKVRVCVTGAYRAAVGYCNSGPFHTGKAEITVRVPVL